MLIWRIIGEAGLPPLLGSLHWLGYSIEAAGGRDAGPYSKPPQHLPSALQELAKATRKQEWAAIKEIDIPLCQHYLLTVIDFSLHDQLIPEAADFLCRALVLSSTIPHAGDQLKVIPSQAFGLHIQDQEFRLCLKY